jgi:RNA methyltransferase, TrmH family
MQELKSRKNPLVVHLKKLGADGGYRRECAEFLCDGEKLLREAVVARAEIKTVFTSGGSLSWLPEHLPVYRVVQELIESVSPHKNPQSVLFSCAIPPYDPISTLVGRGFPDAPRGTILILEGIQDPGNVGTILRTANAFGIGAVLLTGNCADPYHPKTVRATMGAIFRRRFYSTDMADIAALKSGGYKLYGAALAPGARDIRDVPLQNAAVAVGSEGRGLSPELLAMCDEKLIIPMAPESESLNAAVAAAIVMWEASK